MSELLNKKSELIKEMKKITENMLSSVIADDLDEYENLLDKRQALMDAADAVNIKIAETADIKAGDLAFKSVQAEINKDLKEIIEINEKIKKHTLTEIKKARAEYSEADKKIQKRDFEFEDEDKKPSGYFINQRG